MFFDDNAFQELDENLTSKDPLNFEDTKKYPDRVKAAQEKTNLKDAVSFSEDIANNNSMKLTKIIYISSQDKIEFELILN